MNNDITEHMTLAEYQKIKTTFLTGKIKTNKKPLTSYNDCPLENVECQRFAMQLTEWANMGLVLKFSHIANESSNKLMNIRNNRIGVRSGCPDFVVVLRNSIAFVEMKRQHGGKVNDEQTQWIEAINQAGGHATVAKGASEAIAFIEGLL